MSLIFVDCEAWGNSPVTGQLTEFGAVEYKSRKTFHGVVVPGTRPSKDNPAVPEKKVALIIDEWRAFVQFETWLNQFAGDGRLIFISDNPAFDWQWINAGFWKHLNRNPFGHSARRIGDFAAGLAGDFYQSSKWKQLRVTKHDHNPVNDAMGNVEAFSALLGQLKLKLHGKS